MPRKPLATVLLHWSLFVVLVIAFVTGLRIAADTPGSSAAALAWLLPQGEVLLWHRWSGLLMPTVTVGYLVLLGVSNGFRRFRWSRARGVVQRIDLLLYAVALALLLLLLLTGLLQYTRPFVVPMPTLEALHRAAAWGLPLFLVGHIAVQLLLGGWRRLLSIFLPKAVLLSAALLAVGISGLALGAAWWLDRQSERLEIRSTATPPRLDGEANDPVWQQARPLHLLTANGANFPNGQSRVTVRAARDSERAYFLFEWEDPTRSQKHLPLVKSEQGWRVKQSALLKADENRYYEDKFAVMLARDRLAALASIHLGERPLADRPGPANGRGLHYTRDGSVIDVWHWKSVRNNPLRQADDNHFGPPADSYLPLLEDGASLKSAQQRAPQRYTGGYRKDPPMTWDGYGMNWEYFSEESMLPRRLPDDPRDIAHLQQADLSPENSDQGEWWQEWNDTQPYLSERDQLPIGTVLPMVLIKKQLGGDRGQVAARGVWTDGVWRLEMSRALQTGSANDVEIADGIYLWVAAFDHSQTRHTYHWRPVQLHFLD